ncbi:MAG: FHA domain-containing protein [Chloroflexi bacterium]|nr:FHA domain-containing protein [Chloroflexota bacterium]
MNCPKCGTENILGSLFCEDCGTELPFSQGAQEPAPVMVTLKENEKPPAPKAEIPGEKPPIHKAPAMPKPEIKRPEARLVAVETETVFPLISDTNLLGRKSLADGIYPEVDLNEIDPACFTSRKHASILFRGGKFYFEDLGSSNGSFINNEKVAVGVQVPLSGGDRIKLGNMELKFDMEPEN